MKTGKITPNGVLLKPHELATVVLLTELGYDVILIPKSNKEGEHTADIEMVGMKWEMKAPKGSGKYLIQNTLHKAVNQSENIILDLRRIKLYQDNCLAKVRKEFDLTKRIKRIKVITKNGKIIDFEK